MAVANIVQSILSVLKKLWDRSMPLTLYCKGTLAVEAILGGTSFNVKKDVRFPEGNLLVQQTIKGTCVPASFIMCLPPR